MVYAENSIRKFTQRI